MRDVGHRIRGVYIGLQQRLTTFVSLTLSSNLAVRLIIVDKFPIPRVKQPNLGQFTPHLLNRAIAPRFEQHRKLMEPTLSQPRITFERFIARRLVGRLRAMSGMPS